MTEGSSVGRGTAWAVFVLIAIAQYGSFYVYDSIGPVADSQMMAIFGLAGLGGLLFALLLWFTAGRRDQEAATHARWGAI